MLTLLIALTAHANEESPEFVELASVVKDSTLIVVAHEADPAWEHKTEKMKGTKEPFGYTVRHLVVEEVLKGEAKVGDTLHIGPGDLAIQWGGHASYYLHGMEESPIIPSYNSPLFRQKLVETTYIAMIRDCSAGDGVLEMQCFTVSGAMERVKNRAAIEGILKPPPPPPVEPVPPG